MRYDSDSAYVPLPSDDVFIHLIQHPKIDSFGPELCLRDLLGGVYSDEIASRCLFETQDQRLFVLWTIPSDAKSTNDLENALRLARNFLKDYRQPQICIAFNPNNEKKPSSYKDRSILAVFARYDQTLSQNLGVPHPEHEHITQLQFRRNWSETTTYCLHNIKNTLFRLTNSGWIVYISITIICLLLIGLFASRSLKVDRESDKFHSWIAYDTHGSIGPKYQLPLTEKNASEWTSYIDPDSEWELRIDDQALIPRHLMDEEERYYQDWYKIQYPEVDQVRKNNFHLNESWLGSPAVNMVPADDLFHFSHCVLALKRYIKAKDTGRHVCGRDIDRDHMQHCLDSLDWWAFPKENRTETISNSARLLGWRTKVCFE